MMPKEFKTFAAQLKTMIKNGAKIDPPLFKEMPQPEVNMDLPDISDVLQEAKEILKQCFKRFKLGEIFISFNGGKDCTVLLDITINMLQEIYKQDNVVKNLKVVYIRTNGPFREMEEFVKVVERHYGVTLEVTEGELKETLQRILNEDGDLKACLMGTRRTDPYSKDLNFMQKTDANWPQIVRVSPLLNWSYHQIWSYILQRQVPYCDLYDKGYTSIGSIQNTLPNPSLAYKDACGSLAYHPAWLLTDGTLERAGRGPQPKLATNGLQDIETVHKFGKYKDGSTGGKGSNEGGSHNDVL